MTRRAAALLAASALLFAQSDVHAFLISSPEFFSNNLISPNQIQNPAPAPFEKTIVESAMAPLEEPVFKIPYSVLAQFNPMSGENGNLQSTFYYDASGRRVLRHEFSNKNYFDVYRSAQGDESGKLRELQLEGSQNYRFHYGRIQGRDAVRIVLNDSERNHPYQAFEILENGRLGRVLEIGASRGNQFIRERIYDYKAGTLTLNSARNLFEKRIYELKANGEAGRPVQYRNRTAAGDVIHIRFLYNDAEKTLTCVHVNGLHYAVYRLVGTREIGDVLAMGTAKSISRNGQIDFHSVIELSSLERSGQDIPVYIFRKSDVPGYVVRERIADGQEGPGVIGRVLRYASDAADLEYFYAERRGSSPASLTILNHVTRQRIRFELPEKVFDESQGRLNSLTERNSDPLWGAMGHSSAKFFPLKHDLVFGLTGYHQILKGYEETHASITFLNRLLRGPPAKGVNTLESFSSDSVPAFSLSSFLSDFSSASIYIQSLAVSEGGAL